MKKFFLITICILSACENNQIRSSEIGALTGAALGAGLGAIVGHKTGSTGAGIAIGSGAGAIAGGLLGHSADKQSDRLSENDKIIQQQQAQLEQNRKLIEDLKALGADVRDSKRGVVVNLPDVLFEFDRSNLTSSARSTVGEIANVVSKAEGRNIAIEGHTDSIGTADYNQRLSENRANAVAAELVSSGISRSRIFTKGYGESQALASNNTASGRQRNRRVEVIVENR